MGVGCGLPAWIGEAEQRGGVSPALQTRSEGFKLERKAERGEIWLLVRGMGRGGRYFHGSRKFGIASAKKLAHKVSSDTIPYSDMVRRYFVLHLTRLVIINCVGST